MAFVFMFATLVFGYMGWQHVYGGAWLLPIKVGSRWRPILIILTGIIHWILHRYGTRHKALPVLYSICFSLVVLPGYFGGQPVFGRAG